MTIYIPSVELVWITCNASIASRTDPSISFIIARISYKNFHTFVKKQNVYNLKCLSNKNENVYVRFRYDQHLPLELLVHCSSAPGTVRISLAMVVPFFRDFFQNLNRRRNVLRSVCLESYQNSGNKRQMCQCRAVSLNGHLVDE